MEDPSDGQVGRVTVVDDETDVRAVLVEVLSLAGYRVSTVPEDPARLDDVAATQPDVIVLSLSLVRRADRVNGWEYLHALRSHATLRSVPVLLSSADVLALRSRSEELQQDPLIATLELPFSIAELEAAVGQLVQGNRVPDWDEDEDLVLVADADARLVSASRAALKLLRLTASELRGRRVADLVAHPAEWTQREWERYLAERRWEGPVTLRLGDGRVANAISRALILAKDGTDWHVSRLELQKS